MAEENKKSIPADDFEDDFQEEEIYSDNEVAIEDDEAPTLKRKVVEATEEEPKKKKKKHPKKKAQKSPFDGMNIWQEETSVQAAYLEDRVKIALPKLSSVELDEQSLPESAIVNNQNFKQEHTLESLPNYIKFGVARHKALSKPPTECAKPIALIVTHAAIRAVDLVRALKEFASTAKIAKLFAKHFKIEEQVYFLEKESVHLGVGTPSRLQQLVEQGHLSLEKLELVVIDTAKNPKQFNIFDIKDVNSDVFKFLGQLIAPRMKDGKTKIGLF